MLDEICGPDGHDIMLSNPLVPDVLLQYTSWQHLGDDIDDARIFGGVHDRFDQYGATGQGVRVGEYVLAHALRPLDDSTAG